MKLDARITQSLGVSQQLNLAPQLLQWLRLLQLPSAELFTMVQHELEVNPSLEIDESSELPGNDFEEQVSNGDISDPELTNFDSDDLGVKYEMLAEMDQDWRAADAVPGDSAELNKRHQFMINSITRQVSLQEHLMGQLRSMRLGAELASATELLIGSLDRRGYLSEDISVLGADAGFTRALMSEALELVQSLEPVGIGARNLRECLLLQIEDHSSLAARMVTEYLDALGRHQYVEIAEALGVTEADVDAALTEIRALNPAPGEVFNSESAHYIKADVTITRVGADYIIELNDKYLPRLRVAAYCQEMLENGQLKGADSSYLRKKIRASSFLIQGIRQRQETMRKVSLAILHYQRDFFDHKNGVLKPLTMAQIAQDINVHETTVSRALANKYMQTPRGLFEMKYFFCAGYQRDDGSAVNANEVKDMIARMIEEEPPARPLIDLEIVKRCKKLGVNLARRTVAKYREELGIASSKERRYYRRQPKVQLVAGLPVRANDDMRSSRSALTFSERAELETSAQLDTRAVATL